MTGALFCSRPDPGNAYLFCCEAHGLPKTTELPSALPATAQ